MPTPRDPPAATPGQDSGYWPARFDAASTPWDRGRVNPQLETWLRTGLLKPHLNAEARAAGGDDPRLTRVLVTACGSGHDVAMLAEWGFDVTGVARSPGAAEQTRERLRSLLQSPHAEQVNRAEVVERDVLQYRPTALFDAIYEQAGLCALSPDHWRAYAERLSAWLKRGGRLYALFTQAPRAAAAGRPDDGPPFHCDLDAMRSLFPAADWEWSLPPYPSIPHPGGTPEIAVILTRR